MKGVRLQTQLRCEDLWLASVKRHKERQREENRLLWAEHFEHMARLHANLAASYTAKAEALCQEPEAPGDASSTSRIRVSVYDGNGPYPDPGPGGTEQAATACYEGMYEESRNGVH